MCVCTWAVFLCLYLCGSQGENSVFKLVFSHLLCGFLVVAPSYYKCLSGQPPFCRTSLLSTILSSLQSQSRPLTGRSVLGNEHGKAEQQSPLSSSGGAPRDCGVTCCGTMALIRAGMPSRCLLHPPGARPSWLATISALLCRIGRPLIPSQKLCSLATHHVFSKAPSDSWGPSPTPQTPSVPFRGSGVLLPAKSTSFTIVSHANDLHT